MNKDEALEIALDYIRRTSHWEKGRDRHDTLKAVEAALAQPWPDLTKRDRESYQKGHNDGVAHHKQSVKAAQPAQEPVAFLDWYENAIWGNEDFQDGCHRAWDAALEHTPPQRKWVGLTDDEMWNAYTGGSDIINLDYAKAIEAKLKEKNNGT